MFGNFMTVGVGLIVLAVTLLLFWMALPRPNGPPRWFVGSSLEAMVSVAITCGLVLGIGTVAAGLLQLAGVQ